MKICPVCSTQYPDDVRFCPSDGQTLRAASPPDDLVGQVVADRYHVLKKVGEGGMGQVYLGEHVKMGRKSAIKVMKRALVHDPDAVARFNREAANASRITHPNVCAVYDFGETPEGLIYLAMEFIEGESLTDVLQREGVLPVARSVAAFVQVGAALQAAHDLGIVHRDLKPDNIMLSRGRDGSDLVKVVDFGIAKAVGGDASQMVTRTGLVVGTPEFMSPEQLSGDKVDGRSDIYSLALVLYKMLTGTLPFEATTVQETMLKRLTDEPLPLGAARPDLRFPPGLQQTIDAALTRSPAERYQSVTKFVNDVASVAGLQRGVGPLAPLPTTRGGEEKTQVLERPAPRPDSATRRRSRVPIILGAVAVLGGGGAAVAVLGGGRQTDGAARPDTTTRVGGNPVEGAERPLRATPSPARQRIATAPQHVDSAAVDRDLGSIVELVLDPATAEDGRRRATMYYNNSDVPTRLRAQAAFMVAQGLFIERHKEEACRWNGLALRLAPANESYLTFKRDQGCP